MSRRRFVGRGGAPVALLRAATLCAVLLGTAILGALAPAPVVANTAEAGGAPDDGPTVNRRASAVGGDALTVLSNAHSVVFGKEMRFGLELEGSAPITSIVLAYRTSDTQGTTVETMAFAPDKRVRVEYVHSIAERYVRPFVRVSYWWTIVDLMGTRLVTEPLQFLYTDDRFPWQELPSDGEPVWAGEAGIRLHWYQGDVEVAQQALNATRDGLALAEEMLGKPRPDDGPPIEVYLYASADDLASSLPPGTPPDVEALTLHELNVILTSFGPEAAYIPDLQRVLAHEATHTYLHAVLRSMRGPTQEVGGEPAAYTGGGSAVLPLWLEEGLATSVQHAVAPDPDARTLLEMAARDNALHSLVNLCAAFPPDPAEARLAYAQSASVIDFIQARYGRRRLRQLFDAYVDGATCEGGVYRVLGVSLEGLEAQWRAELTDSVPADLWSVSRGAGFWTRNGAYLALIVVLALPTFVVLLSTWRRQAVQRRRAGPPRWRPR